MNCLNYETIFTLDGLRLHPFGWVEGIHPDTYMYDMLTLEASTFQSCRRAMLPCVDKCFSFIPIHRSRVTSIDWLNLKHCTGCGFSEALLIKLIELHPVRSLHNFREYNHDLGPAEATINPRLLFLRNDSLIAI